MFLKEATFFFPNVVMSGLQSCSLHIWTSWLFSRYFWMELCNWVKFGKPSSSTIAKVVNFTIKSTSTSSNSFYLPVREQNKDQVRRNAAMNHMYSIVNTVNMYQPNESPNSLFCMSLDYWRKPQYPEKKPQADLQTPPRTLHSNSRPSC